LRKLSKNTLTNRNFKKISLKLRSSKDKIKLTLYLRVVPILERNVRRIRIWIIEDSSSSP
jgi:hypothetical protein